MTSRSKAGYIGPNLVIHGRLSGKGEITIDGSVEGDIAVNGVVRIGPVGNVTAAVEADTVEVAGRLKGAVSASEEVAVRDGGVLDGDVYAPGVSIDDGGLLYGGIQMEFDLPETLDRGEE